MGAAGWIKTTEDGDGVRLQVGGEWLVAHAAALDQEVAGLRLPTAKHGLIDLSEVTALDTVGAWLLLRLERRLKDGGAEFRAEKLAPELVPLFEQVEKRPLGEVPVRRRRIGGFTDALAFVGEKTFEFLGTARDLLGFFGLVTVTGLRLLAPPGRVRFVSVVAHMQRTGVSALPIVGLLSFLIGIVFAYQGADQLRQFGAEIYTVNLLGIAFLRELGVLLTSIIIAGRSGSAFTAEIGTMQVNEEIDALRTLGIDPIEVLVLPRLGALFVTLPLLTFYANVMGLLGGALMCWAVLDIQFSVFLQQLRGAITGWTPWLGMFKAFFFAICIALIGCHEGLRVSRSAESVGRLTTRSVVESIFLVIIIDAAFSILFSKLHL